MEGGLADCLRQQGGPEDGEQVSKKLYAFLPKNEYDRPGQHRRHDQQPSQQVEHGDEDRANPIKPHNSQSDASLFK
jgi:hypothetical protein